MPMIAPSILSADFGRLDEEVRCIAKGGADWIHVDVMDGHFVPNLTIGPLLVKPVKKASMGLPVDVHLMMTNPGLLLEAFVNAGADYLTVHAEACTHLHRTLQQIEALGAKPGVALNPHTSEAVLDYVLPHCFQVLVMSVNPGFGGQSFIDSSLQKIERLANTIERRGLNTIVAVDGGVKAHNASRIVSAGAGALIAGSAVFGAEDRAAAIAALR